MGITTIILIILGIFVVAVVIAITAKPVIDMQNELDGTEGWFQGKPKGKEKGSGR